MKGKNCTHCGQPIVLTPSAAERARKFGGNPSDYTNLFTTHADCQLELRDGKKAIYACERM